VNALRAFLRDNQRDYAQLGRLGEAERDRIEEEVGAAVRSCSANIDKLQGMLASAAATAGSPARQRGPPSADLLAHRQGQVLILSERLRAATALFDRLRSLRYQQLQQAEANRLRRLPQREAAAGAGAPQTTAELHERLRQQQAAGGSIGQQQPQQQQQIDAENQALQLELLGMNDQVGEGRSGDDCHMLLVPLSWGACCWSRSLCGGRTTAGASTCACQLAAAPQNKAGWSCNNSQVPPATLASLPAPFALCRCSTRSARCERLPH
jgi:hypothetical protein